MRQLLFAVCMMASLYATAQNTYDKYTDNQTKKIVYKGLITPNDLDKESQFDWYKKGVKRYKPDPIKLSLVKPSISNYRLVVFMGTWCEDSHVLIPELVKVLQVSNYPMDHLTMYGVDMEKKTLGDVQQPYNIELVPTIIVMKDGKEVGRVVESSKINIETDLLNILEKDWAMGTPAK